jgi:hypothetical protein
MEVEEPIRVSPPMSPAMSPRCRVAGEAEAAPRTQSYHFRAYSYYNRTGGNDDERPINGHTFCVFRWQAFFICTLSAHDRAPPRDLTN